jgi:hypothetical protein
MELSVGAGHLDVHLYGLTAVFGAKTLNFCLHCAVLSAGAGDLSEHEGDGGKPFRRLTFPFSPFCLHCAVLSVLFAGAGDLSEHEGDGDMSTHMNCLNGH